MRQHQPKSISQGASAESIKREKSGAPGAFSHNEAVMNNQTNHQPTILAFVLLFSSSFFFVGFCLPRPSHDSKNEACAKPAFHDAKTGCSCGIRHDLGICSSRIIDSRVHHAGVFLFLPLLYSVSMRLLLWEEQGACVSVREPAGYSFFCYLFVSIFFLFLLLCARNDD